MALVGASQSFANRCQPRQVPTRPLRSGRCRSVLRIYAVALAEPVAPGVQTLVSKVTGEGDAQQTILDAVSGVKGRGKSGIAPEALEALEQAVEILEDKGGVQAPTNSTLLEGRWRLLFTTRPGSASPIQRTFTGVDAFTVYQEILLDGPNGARVNNIVDFGGRIGQLKVEAEANTVSRPLPGFTPRKGKGLPLFGKSESTPPSSPEVRIDFQFDTAAFDLAVLPFKIPYPVPFKLLGDETKGWLDITYLSPDGQFRLSRGNKGTLFVLVRDPSPRECLLQAIQGGRDDEVQQAIEVLQDKGSPISKPAKSSAVFGRWRLRWSKQAGGANPLQKLGGGSGRSWQTIRPDGTVENRAIIIPALLTLRADATCQTATADRTTVDIRTVYIEIGPLK
ncbi:hypothetical protein WJX84_010652 [Apatococcus fuscideae]|uniref:Plastid lipid-associated protein/fibrillin conserved domain-containing protein n=1 Tax=Apatococcus fuscideae TaxID=2026836 RepID=A0AAW1TAE5_9CHLO